MPANNSLGLTTKGLAAAMGATRTLERPAGYVDPTRRRWFAVSYLKAAHPADVTVSDGVIIVHPSDLEWPPPGRYNVVRILDGWVVADKEAPS